MFWHGTDTQLHSSHAATCWNAYEQFDLYNNLSDVKMTSPALGGGNAYYITSCGATNLKFGEIIVISNMWKVNKNEMNKFNTFGIIWYFIILWCHFDITGRSSVNRIYVSYTVILYSLYCGKTWFIVKFKTNLFCMKNLP